jgi:hypothetical protein
MADASSIRKATTLPVATGFYRGGIRWYNNQAVVSTGTQWAPLGNTVLSIPVTVIAEAVDQLVFVADRAYVLVSCSEVHATAGGAGATVALKKSSTVQAIASGTAMLTAALPIDGTANTVQSGVLSATAANTKLAAGDMLGLDFTGTVSPYAGGTFTIVLQPL